MVVIEERNKEEIKQKEVEIREINKFIIDFNKEAKKQNSKWYVYMVFNEFPHLVKKSIWFLDEVSFQVSYDNGEFCFVDNDYMIAEATSKANIKFFKYYKEFKPILKKIPQKFKVLYNLR